MTTGRSASANIVLVGMRASGKTTLGRRLAARLERPFVDLDEELGRRAGADPDTLLAQRGEPAFRRLERAVLAWAATLRGHVLATGGGAVLHGEAFAALARSSTVVYLHLPADELVRRAAARPRPALTGRPLAEEVDRLLARRDPLYRAAADITIEAGEADPILALLAACTPGPEDDR